uniref:tyrosine-type recombinase/integrase n=1 Tax=Orrella sp. TaxID=1921583 RepID=UPI0040471F00
MPKIVKPLTTVALNRITKPGWYAVGGVAGLLLQVRNPTREGAPLARSWILRVRVGETRDPIGLGSYPQVSLAEAREQAGKLVIEARQGVNLKAKKVAARSALLSAASRNKTFQECAEAYIEAHAADYTNDKHRKQWASTLKVYAYPIIGKRLVADLSMRDVLDVMNQPSDAEKPKSETLWKTKTVTAKRLLDRVKTVIDYAIVNEYRSGLNPAVWQGYLDTQLAAPNKVATVKHHPALPYALMGDFMTKLRTNESISAKALQFLILTAVRSGSVRAAEWSEIDLVNKLWIIPAAHTKTKQEHRVPLPPQAIELLNSLPRLANIPNVFPSPRGGALSDMALSQITRGMKERSELTVDVVPHGFRSTFRDWAAECTAYPDEIRKAASGHTVGDAVQQAYQRTDLLEKRRNLMREWANFIDKPSANSSGNVTPIRRSQA